MPKTIEECRAAHGRVWSMTIEGVGDFIFRKPTSREWSDFDAQRVALGVATSAGSLTKEMTLEYLRDCEELAKRVVVSHTAEELQALDDEYLGIFKDIAQEISTTVDALRTRSGKESPPPGPT